MQVEIPKESLLDRFGSRVAVASVAVGSRSTLVASVHPSTIKVSDALLAGVDRAAVAIPSGSLWEGDIIYAGLRELTVPGQPFIIGGDWMETWLWDRVHNSAEAREFFQRAAADGWVEATAHYFGASEIDLRTWFGIRNGKSTPYQLDRIFVDGELATRLSHCDVDNHPAQRLKLSDHAPLILEFTP